MKEFEEIFPDSICMSENQLVSHLFSLEEAAKMGSIKRISSCSYEGEGLCRSSSLPTLHTPVPVVTTGSIRRKYRDSILNTKCCESTKLCWWEPDPEYPSSTVDFCLDTSLHGMKVCSIIKFLPDLSSNRGKPGWFLSLFLLFLCSTFVSHNDI